MFCESEELTHGVEQVAVTTFFVSAHADEAEIDLDGVLEDFEVPFCQLAPAVVSPSGNLRPSWLVLFVRFFLGFMAKKKPPGGGYVGDCLWGI